MLNFFVCGSSDHFHIIIMCFVLIFSHFFSFFSFVRLTFLQSSPHVFVQEKKNKTISIVICNLFTFSHIELHISLLFRAIFFVIVCSAWNCLNENNGKWIAKKDRKTITLVIFFSSLFLHNDLLVAKYIINILFDFISFHFNFEISSFFSLFKLTS